MSARHGVLEYVVATPTPMPETAKSAEATSDADGDLRFYQLDDADENSHVKTDIAFDGGVQVGYELTVTVGDNVEDEV
jgi:hypothetical protein